jgi:hypothetical protein
MKMPEEIINGGVGKGHWTSKQAGIEASKNAGKPGFKLTK